jgi:hypothetical protein
MNNSHELNQFKTNINLVDYAATFGYSIDNRETSRSNVVMRDDWNDKIIITQQSRNSHWIYWSDRDQSDKGTIIDFIQRRRRLSLGEVRKELRSWSGGVSLNSIHPILKSSPNLQTVRATYDTFNFIQKHPYLINERSIPLSTLNCPKFTHRIKIDSHHNAIFPHFSNGQICGYEIKNSNFTGFAPSGKRGLWCSVWNKSDTLIITESAIDALSFHALRDADGFFYVSLGGQLGKENLSLIQRIAQHQPIRIAIATDNDSSGEEYYHHIDNALEYFKNNGGNVTRITPTHKDWNDDLRFNCQ